LIPTFSEEHITPIFIDTNRYQTLPSLCF